MESACTSMVDPPEIQRAASRTGSLGIIDPSDIGTRDVSRGNADKSAASLLGRLGAGGNVSPTAGELLDQGRSKSCII